MGSQNFWPWNDPKGLRTAAQPNAAYNTNTATAATTITAAQMTGGFSDVALAMTGALTAAANATTDTAANILAAIPVSQRYIGFTYVLRVINESSGAFAWTVVGGTNVTVTGTATVAQNTWREFLVKIATVSTITMQSVGTGTQS